MSSRRLLATTFTASAAALFSFTALTLTPAAAATVTTSVSTLNFGNVSVGGSVTEDVAITISLAAGEKFSSFVNADRINQPDVSVTYATPPGTCSATNFSCTAEITWNPTAFINNDTDVGNIQFFLSYLNSGGVSTEAIGTVLLNGETNMPVPAALPLFATGLGALGLLGWRRKRKARAGVA